MKQVEQLLPLLDEQVELLRQKRSLMQRMGEYVRRNELEKLRELLQAEATLESAESDLEQRTLRIRGELARIDGGQADAVTLGRLVETLDGPLRIALSDRRERLVLLVEQVRREASATALLVGQAIEMNELLLMALTGAEGPSPTYSPEGAIERNEKVTTFRESV